MKGQRIIALTKKELKRVFREPANLFLALVFPLVLTLAFGAAFGAMGSGNGNATYTVGVVDLDQSTQDQWAGYLKGNITATEVLIVQNFETNETAQKALLQGQIDAVVVIPDKFGASIESFWANPTTPSSWTNVSVDVFVDQGSLVVKAAVPPLIQQAIATTIYGEQALTSPQPVTIGTPTYVEADQLSQFDYMAPGLFAYAAIFVTMIVAQAFTEEREKGLLKRIDTTPASASDIFASQILANLTTGVLQVIVVLLVASLMGFNPQGGVAGVGLAFILVLLLVLCNIGFGLITSSIAKSSGAATGISFLFILPQMFLGSFVPAPESVARIVPSYYVTDALTSIFLRGAPVSSPTILLDLLAIAIFGFATIIVGILVYKRFGIKR